MIVVCVIVVVIYLIIRYFRRTKKSGFSGGMVRYNDVCKENYEGDLPLKGELSDKQMCKDWVQRHLPQYSKILPRTYFKTKDMGSLYRYLSNRSIDKFVLKNTHGSGMNIVVKDGKTRDINDLVRRSKEFLKTCFHCGGPTEIEYLRTKQTFYKYNDPQIIIEEYIGDNPSDYKFHIIDGEIKFFQVDSDRFGNHYRNIYSPTGEFLPNARIVQKVNNSYPDPSRAKLPRDFMASLPFMKKMAMDIYNKVNTLSEKPIRLLRVDYFFINGRPYLGELTLTHGVCKQKFKGIPGIIYENDSFPGISKDYLH